ncbi:hypothetical protein GCM10010910_26700 [Microbacterium nanhaiense]|uniref:Uncharacterized protein n=1 Tax=Microbacterium nanhaiense TaxID=1301026 RepID=A0ABQ2N5W5_9MICO|nr:hypothetical protein GCM10010910_26700 [Microbacterium nanhaiense]
MRTQPSAIATAASAAVADPFRLSGAITMVRGEVMGLSCRIPRNALTAREAGGAAVTEIGEITRLGRFAGIPPTFVISPTSARAYRGNGTSMIADPPPSAASSSARDCART